MINVPNVGEKEMIKSLLAAEAIVLGLYKNQVQADGSVTIDTLEELATGGGRGYAQISLTNDVVEGSVVADKWSVVTDANGKAAAAYSNAVQQWTFAAADVADGETAYGVFGYTWVLPFKTGTKEIRVGDKVKGVTSAATGIVTSVMLFTGTWGAGTAVGELRIKTKTGTFQDSENITISGSVATFTIAAAGTAYAVGDIISITQSGASGAKLVVTAVDGYGGVTSAVVVDGGQGYSAATGLGTTHLTGAGNNDCTITIATLAATVYAATNTGTANSGDALKKLMYIDPFSTAQLITPAGFAIQYPAALTLSASS